MNNEKIAELVRAERNAYSKAWRAKNKDKIALINKRYWQNRALKNLQALDNNEVCNNEHS